MRRFGEFLQIMKSKRRGGRNKNESKWSSNGGGMGKHHKSGTSIHKKFAIIRSREYNKQTEEELLLQKSRKPQMYNSIKEIL